MWKRGFFDTRSDAGFRSASTLRIIADLEEAPARKEADVDVYLRRVRAVLARFDALPRLAPALDADGVIGYDRWGLPEG